MLNKWHISPIKCMHAVFPAPCVGAENHFKGLQLRRIASPAANVISNAFEALKSQSGDPKVIKNQCIAPLAEYVLSKEEAITTLQLCLANNLHDDDVFANCIKVLEDEYFKPILLPDENQQRHPFVERCDFADKPYEFIQSLSIEDKTKLILWQWQVHKRGFPRVYINKDTPTKTEEIDPAKREMDDMRTFGKVLDPKPLKATFKVKPPGKRLSSLLALTLRQAIPTASLADLALISLIFTTPLPFTGQLNEDTIRLLEQRFADCTPEELEPYIHPISAFCRGSKQRFVDIWSFNNPKIHKGFKRHHLHKIEAQRLGKVFASKFSKALKASADINGFEIAMPPNLSFNKLSVIVHTLWNLSYSDIALPLEIWESHLDKIKAIAHQQAAVDAATMSYFCEAVFGFKYTGTNTMEATRLLILKCKDSHLHGEIVNQTLAFLNLKIDATPANDVV